MYNIEEIKNTILYGNCLEELKKFPDESIDVICTSPPYWLQRNYGVEPTLWEKDKNCNHIWKKIIKKPTGGSGKNSCVGGNRNDFSNLRGYDIESQICEKCGSWIGVLGNEPYINLFIDNLCFIFDEAKRVLKKTGSCFIVIADKYMPSSNYKDSVVKPQSLCLIPEKFSIAMQERGWSLINKICWRKKNCQPENVTKRFTRSWEYILFFVKDTKNYFFNQQFEKAITKYSGSSLSDNITPYAVGERKTPFLTCRNLPNKKEFSNYINEKRKQKNLSIETVEKIFNSQAPHHWFNGESFPSKEDYTKLKNILYLDKRYDKNLIEEYLKSSAKKTHYEGRNTRDCWDINTKPFSARSVGIKDVKHYATYPERLVEKVIDCACPKNICTKCGFIEKKQKNEAVYRHNISLKEKTEKHVKDDNEMVSNIDCNCGVSGEPCIVLDPFMGAGTSAVVARKKEVNFVGIELNKDYIRIANNRLKGIKKKLF